jgi:serine/threonine protein phosphatase PrpC
VIDAELQKGDIKEITLRAQSGSTALVAVIEEDHITVGNVGDCRAGWTHLFCFAVLDIKP